MAKHDWATIRKEYVEAFTQDEGLHWPTLQEIAQRHGVPLKYLRHKAGQESWVDQRRTYGAKVARSRQDARAKTLAKAGAKFDADILRLAEALVTMLSKTLESLSSADTEAIRKVSAAIVNVQRAGRIALGEPADGPLPAGDARGGVLVVRIIRDGPYGNTSEAVAETEHFCSKNQTETGQKPNTIALNSWPRDTQES